MASVRYRFRQQYSESGCGGRQHRRQAKGCFVSGSALMCDGVEVCPKTVSVEHNDIGAHNTLNGNNKGMDI